MGKQHFRLSTKSKYLFLYIACILLCLLNVLLIGEYSRNILLIFAILYGIISCIMVGNFWKPNIVFLLYNSICSLLVKWIAIDQSIALIMAEPVISLLFSFSTWLVIKKVRPDFWNKQPEPADASPSVDENLLWIKRNSAGLTIILVSNLCFFVLFATEAVLFELIAHHTILNLIHTFILFPLTGLMLGIVSYTKTKRFAAICGIFLGFSVLVAPFATIPFLFINELYFVYSLGIAVIAFFGYLLGNMAGLLAKFADSTR